jgi:hypothetical protein
VSDPGAEPPVVAGPGSGRSAIACPRCGAPVAGDQSWCLECGLAARTRLARTPDWRTPLVAAAAIGLAAIVALIIAFLILTSDNAPLPTTAAPATTVTTAAPVTTTPATTTTTATVVTGDPSVATTPTVPTTATTATTTAP